jgi:hypothetical protein
MTAQIKTVQTTNEEVEESSWRGLCKIGGVAALVVVGIAVLQAPIFILYPQPTTVLGHIEQFQQSKLLGLIDLDLMLVLAEALTIPVFFALYAALRRINPALMTVALAFGLGGIVFFFAVNPTFSMLYLSDQYAAATAGQRSALLAAGEALIASYNGTAFGLYFVLSGIADIIIAAVMLRSSVFSKLTAYIGMVMGVMLLVPPLPALGMFALVLSYVVIVPSLVWNILVALGLFRASHPTPTTD